MGERAINEVNELKVWVDPVLLRPMCEKVGCVRISSRSAKLNSYVETEFQIWLKANGWENLVTLESDSNSLFSGNGFDDISVQFIPGALQSNGFRSFQAEIPQDMRDLKEELQIWLTEIETPRLDSI